MWYVWRECVPRQRDGILAHADRPLPGIRKAHTTAVDTENSRAAQRNGRPIHGPPRSMPMRRASDSVGPAIISPTFSINPMSELRVPTWCASTSEFMRLRRRDVRPAPPAKMIRARVSLG